MQSFFRDGLQPEADNFFRLKPSNVQKIFSLNTLIIQLLSLLNLLTSTLLRNSVAYLI